MVRLRPFEAGDVDGCLAVIDAAVRELVDANEAAREIIRAHNTPPRLGAELAAYHSVVAEDDRGIVGVGALDGDEVKRVYVRPDSQRVGVGGAVMRELEREARRRGIAELRLTAGASAAAFYERLGWERLEAGEFVDGEARVPFVKMRKRLAETNRPSADAEGR